MNRPASLLSLRSHLAQAQPLLAGVWREGRGRETDKGEICDQRETGSQSLKEQEKQREEADPVLKQHLPRPWNPLSFSRGNVGVLHRSKGDSGEKMCVFGRLLICMSTKQATQLGDFCLPEQKWPQILVYPS